MHATLPFLLETDFPAIRRGKVEILQVNLGYRCNQTCVHCHVNAGPTRKEEANAETCRLALHYLAAAGVRQLDITGGAPELNRNFRNLVVNARALGAEVIDRCNLTILEEPGQEDLTEFLAGQRVIVTASLPCYLEENVDRQRGKGVFEQSLRALRRLNALGYGHAGSGLTLNLVYNPQGPTLPPPQAALEASYKKALWENYGIVFNNLSTLANMPIERFGSLLISKGRFSEYMRLLRSAHCDENLEEVMCRKLLSVDWQGYVYDCDFNQMLGIPLQVPGRPLVHLSRDLLSLPVVWLKVPGRRRVHLSDLLQTDLDGNPVAVASHCFGCTAGQGSSCSGALTEHG